MKNSITQNDITRIEQKLDQIIQHFNIEKNPEMEVYYRKLPLYQHGRLGEKQN